MASSGLWIKYPENVFKWCEKKYKILVIRQISADLGRTHTAQFLDVNSRSWYVHVGKHTLNRKQTVKQKNLKEQA